MLEVEALFDGNRLAHVQGNDQVRSIEIVLYDDPCDLEHLIYQGGVLLQKLKMAVIVFQNMLDNLYHQLGNYTRLVSQDQASDL
jgi:hypothetical protein